MNAPGQGQMLTHYRLVEQIGEGGMGVVWSAEDTKLERQVAIKILPDAFAADPQRLARFEREAKLLAALNHPNVAGIYGFDRDGGVHFLVLELVPGETLAEMLRRGPLAIEDSLEIGRQVAEGLEAAHQADVIHRDLKPANIKVTPDGKAKVLDFGLAKGLEGAVGSSTDLSMSPTVTTVGGTEAGVVLGTAPYMSPEQARGKTLDRRTDIWSFGCLLFECLVGRPAFHGETVTDVLAAILQRDVDWDSLPERTPLRVRDLLERCLERSLRNRMHDISDARIVLEKSVAIREWTTAGIAAAPELPGTLRRGGARGWYLLAAGLVVGAVGMFLAGLALRPSTPDLPLRKFQLATRGGEARRPEISPDGTRVAYFQDDRLWVRDLRRIEPRPLTGGEGVSLHAWSPDGRWLAISRDAKLWKLPATGGEPVLLTALPESLNTRKAAGLTWGSDGRIGYNVGNAGLMTVPEQGGTAVSILEPGEGEQDFHYICALPDGRGYLFAVHTDDAVDTLAVVTDAGRKDILRIPGQDLSEPAYSLSGHLLFWRSPDNAGLWAVAFSLERLEVTGEPFPVTPTEGPRFSVSRDETLVFTHPAPPRSTRLALVDRQGRVVRTVGEPQLDQTHPAVSPDGGRVAVSVGDDDARDIWIHDVESGTQMRLTFDDSRDGSPSWHPSGDRVGFTRYSALAGQADLYLAAADGSGETTRLVRGTEPAFSSDGRFLAYTAPDAQLDRDIWSVTLDEDGQPGEPVQFLETDGRFDVHFSPDGRFLVYSANITGRSEIYISRYPAGEGKWQVSNHGGEFARWSPQGDRIFYRQGQDLMEVPVTAGASPSLGQPSKLFTWDAVGRGFDVTPDGRLFVMVEETDPGAAGPQIVVVQNWPAEFSPDR